MDVYGTLSHPLALAVFVLTLFLPVLVGVVAMWRTRSQSDFFVGGRAMRGFVVALSAVSSGRSSWLVLGLSGIAYARGASAVWAFVGYTAVELVQCLYLGPRLRTETERSVGLGRNAVLAGRSMDRVRCFLARYRDLPPCSSPGEGSPAAEVVDALLEAGPCLHMRS